MLTTNALDEDRYVLKNKNKGIPMTIYPVDGTDVSRRRLSLHDLARPSKLMIVLPSPF